MLTGSLQQAEHQSVLTVSEMRLNPPVHLPSRAGKEVMACIGCWGCASSSRQHKTQ